MSALEINYKNMFGKKDDSREICSGIEKEAKLNIEKLEKEIADLKHSHTLEILESEAEHKIALKEKEFELKHFKDEEMKKMSTDLDTQKRENAVLKKENEMLVKITDLNADVIDVKELVGSLIKKLPEINLTSLTVQSTDKK